MSTLNLGILAHVDAGKTSLTERLLYAAGVIDQIGRVDHGNTQTDSLALERTRGITIKSAVVSFVVDGVTVNLIDTPGHPDFIAEVERVLGVLDGVVLVVSAVEGVQAQTRVLMRTLQRLRIPVVIFVNKIDRSGAQYDAVLRVIRERLSPAIVAMGAVREIGTRAADFTPYGGADLAFSTAAAELLAEHDDEVLAAYVTGEGALPPQRLQGELAAQTARALVHPVYFGSAITGAGVSALIVAITTLLPTARTDTKGPATGSVFKIERGPAGDRIALVRMFSGTLHVRDRVRVGRGHEGTVTGITVFADGTTVRRADLRAAQIGQVWGLGDVQIGDQIGAHDDGQPGTPIPKPPESQQFSPPTLETVIRPTRPSQRGLLYAALKELAEQDPLINLRLDRSGQEISVSLYGEVQKEVIASTLADEYGIEVEFRETTTIYIERPTGSGAAVELIAVEPNPFLATVGLRIDPAPVDSGVEFRLEVELGSMPLAFFVAVEETVHEALAHGNHGWRVTDCVVTMTHSGYWARQSRMHGGFDKSMSSTAGDFRGLTPVVLGRAVQRAGTQVCEPIHRFTLVVPADTFGPISPVLARLRAVPQQVTTRGTTTTVEGEVPAAQVNRLLQQLSGLTRGEGDLETTFDHYRPLRHD